MIWITGASSGIGEALVYSCIKEQASLIISSRNLESLNLIAKSCHESFNPILVLPFDLETNTNYDALVCLVIKKFGRIDILINNGGMGHRTHAVNTGPT